MPKLPKDILIMRVRQEIAMCKRKLDHIIAVEDDDIVDIPTTIMVTLVNVPGPVMKEEEELDHKYTHQFTMMITDEYPYQKPIVRWQSEIFHPNIMPPEDGGYVCTKLLDDWTFQSNLTIFIKGVETMLANPNPANPYATETCLQAARYFSRHKYRPPVLVERKRPKPRIVR